MYGTVFDCIFLKQSTDTLPSPMMG